MYYNLRHDAGVAITKSLRLISYALLIRDEIGISRWQRISRLPIIAGRWLAIAFVKWRAIAKICHWPHAMILKSSICSRCGSSFKITFQILSYFYILRLQVSILSSPYYIFAYFFDSLINLPSSPWCRASRWPYRPLWCCAITHVFHTEIFVKYGPCLALGFIISHAIFRQHREIRPHIHFASAVRPAILLLFDAESHFIAASHLIISVWFYHG